MGSSVPPDPGTRAERFQRDLNAIFAAAVRVEAEPDILQRTLDAAMRAVAGTRGFLALVDHQTGELAVVCTSGEGWTDDNRRLRLHLAQETDRGITGHVALKAEPYVTGDVMRDPHYLRYFDDVRSELAVPILGASGQSNGVINLESTELNAFTPDDCAHVVSLAHAAAAALRVQGFRARETALIETGNTLTTLMDVDELMAKVVHVAADVIQFEGCSVFLVDEASGGLMLKASSGVLGAQVGAVAYRPGEGLTGWVAAHGLPIRLAAPHDDPRWRGRLTEFPQEEIGAFLAVPITSRSRVLGVMRVLRRQSAAPWFSNRFMESDERLLSAIASQLGVAVENARNYQRLVHVQRMAAWGEMSARSAHMIGNRAFALKGDLNELRYLLEALPEQEATAEIRGLAESMGRGIERLEEILREFRDFVMATQLALAPVDLDEVLREAIEETYPRRSPVALSLDLAASLPRLRCDARKLKRAFSELIENALSFQPEGGEVRIASRLAGPDDHALCGIAPSLASVIVEVADRGPGVADDARERIFEPFYTSRVKGMGLGLSIVKGIVEAHEGCIREVGTPGQGARFLIALPVLREPRGEPEEPRD
ncbi:MAG: GAF domain-containing protein [Chthonomonadales bacterium]|nr:GAF domain-containing protein [Chthonomonadales bacterium]